MNLEEKFNLYKQNMIGYPLNTNIDVAQHLGKYLDYMINNIGDPFKGSNYKTATCQEEIEVLTFFANLFNAPSTWWGYITSGGSESNFRGITFANKMYPDGVFYYSSSSHYSISKVANLINLKNVRLIKSQASGKIDLDDFLLNVDKTKPIIINLNVGTTMKGAIDDVIKFFEIVDEIKVPKYVHIDAALMGTILPFMEYSPKFDFDLPINSISVSGHKFLGCPIPCGIFISREKYLTNQYIEYIGAEDCTIFGSRSGLVALLMNHIIKNNNIKEMVNYCIEKSIYLRKQLEEINYYYSYSPYSITTWIPEPGNYIVDKWQLAKENDIAHIITMPSITNEIIDNFINDLNNKHLN